MELGDEDMEDKGDNFLAGLSNTGVALGPVMAEVAGEVLAEEQEAAKKRRLQQQQLQQQQQQQQAAPSDPMLASFAKMLDAKFSAQTTQLDTTIASHVEPIKTILTQHTGELATLRTTVESLQAARESQQKQIDALQKRTIGSEIGSTTASGSGNGKGDPWANFSFKGTRGEFGTGLPRPTFVPSWISIRGWARGGNDDLSKRSKQLVPNAVAQRLLASIFGQIKGIVEHLDDVRTCAENQRNPMGCYQLKIYFKPTASKSMLWEFQKAIVDCFSRRQIFEDPADTNTYTERICSERIVVNVEASPWQAPYIGSAGKFKALFHKHKSTAAPFVKIEKYGPPITHIWAYPSEQATGDGECVASYKHDREPPWKLDEAMLKQIDPQFKVTNFKAELE